VQTFQYQKASICQAQALPSMLCAMLPSHSTQAQAAPKQGVRQAVVQPLIILITYLHVEGFPFIASYILTPIVVSTHRKSGLSCLLQPVLTASGTEQQTRQALTV